MEKVALIAGSTGITGSNLAIRLIREGWTTYGISRKASEGPEGLRHIAADLLDEKQLTEALQNIRPTHVFITTWMRQDTETENIRVNSALVRNLLNALAPGKSLRHVALVTGLKHYLGPFEAYAKDGFLPQTPLREEQPRLPRDNFYYAQEDEVYAAAARDGFTWSVHRPHTVIGKAVGNLMNLGTTLAVYASICKAGNLPFIWPGSKAQWSGLSDVTDAGILAEQMLWAATTPTAGNEAFNIVNGDLFRWEWLWKEIAGWFGLPFVPFDGTVRPLEQAMEAMEETWKKIADTHQLSENQLGKLASPWHTDLDLGRPIEVMTDMYKSRKLGFTGYRGTRESFFRLFGQLREERLIP